MIHCIIVIGIIYLVSLQYQNDDQIWIIIVTKEILFNMKPCNVILHLSVCIKNKRNTRISIKYIFEMRNSKSEGWEIKLAIPFLILLIFNSMN